MSQNAKTAPRKAPEDKDPAHKPGKPPAAGPHAKPELTDSSKTPGSGTLPDPERPHDGDATSG
ncbi:hypothetical protein GCM10007301_27730 [Azorhizobium oxalatiphilum]|uniref:Uncharacterized protein n=1 Tax=Azorhizobium oxalatiphilum TaxID=980631 RepID=A0A917C1R7_9HYPH|nr:hypothetical protein [Azorhizobium oxalatiphilum]GGF66471.1 hypothetical protein GCM10007301_27730 [Azorhizobium oxalatiphilum]